MSKKKTTLKNLGDIDRHIQDNPELKAYGKLVAFITKSIAWYNSFSESEKAYIRYAELRYINNLSVEDAFDWLKKELILHKKDLAEAGLNDDPDAFRRKFTKSVFVRDNHYINRIKNDPDAFRVTITLPNKK